MNATHLMRRLTIRHRFIATTLLIGGVMVALLLATWLARGKSARAFDAALTDQVAMASQIDELKQRVATMRRHEAAVLTNSANPDEATRFRGLWLLEQKAVLHGFDSLALGRDAASALAVESAKGLKALNEYIEALAPVLEQVAATTLGRLVATARAAKAEPSIVAIDTSLDAVLKRTRAHLDAARAEATQQDRLLALAGAAGGLLVLLLVGLVMWLTYKSVQGPLDEARRMAQRIVAQDLSVDPSIAGRDELTELLRSMAEMQASLRQMVGQVRSSTDGIGTASAEIASGNQDLSVRTEQTASNLQQAASAMEQLTGTVHSSAGAARQANQLAASAAEVAQKGGRAFAQVVATMDEINGSSKRIADIIGVIDGIAFQTNILALNAAVEAARAGDQGRGFAVVAGEVRSLAMRSGDAAKEIRQLIARSVDNVDGGTRQVADAGRTMQEIVDSVRRVSDIIGEISTAADEQSKGIGLVNDSVNHLDEMTQQNSALVEQSAAAAESLKDQTARLGSLVARFNLGIGRSAPA